MDGLFGKYKVILAPMAGVTDICFRQLCVEQGADLTFTEMVSAKGLSYANEKTRHLIDLSPVEVKAGVQIFGHESDVMARQAAYIEEELADHLAIIDINMGCPARKIVKKGDGAGLAKDPYLAAEIMAQVVSSVSVPVSAKMRRGWSEGEENAPELAKRLEDAGASALTVHGRYATQLYNGRADWGVISRVKEAVSIPVVGNGDIRSGKDALSMVKETNCDAVMIARAAEGNPWIFSEIKAALSGIPESDWPSRPSPKERIEGARRHAKMLDESDRRMLAKMRKHAMWYTSGICGAAIARGKLNYCETLEDFENVFDELIEKA